VIEIRLDRSRCQGYGNCVLVAPELFDLDADGLAVVNHAYVGDEHLVAVRKAVYDCPTGSISFVEGAAPPD
jgi:ferredoxin